MNEMLQISYQEPYGEDEAVLMVFKFENNQTSIVNMFTGQEATDLYDKISEPEWIEVK